MVILRGYTSEILGQPVFVDDRFGNQKSAVQFDGNSSLVTDIDMSELFMVGDPVTISIWFNSTQETFREAIVSGSRPGGGPDFNLLLESGILKTRLYAGSPANTARSYNDGDWHHVVWGTDGADTYFYIDGEMQALAPTIGSNSRDLITFGALRDTEHRFTGLVDDFKLYNKAISEEEILNLYLEGSDLDEVIDLSQLRIDGESEIGVGETFVGNGFVLSGDVGIDESGLERGVEVEVKPVGEEFDGVGVRTSELGTSTIASMLIDDLFDQGDLYGGNNESSFKWRARTVDENGNTSAWVDFGENGSDADFAIKTVPLVTQTASPFPSFIDTQGWQNTVYAGGRASSTGDCGLSIRECGCVLSSLSTLAYHHGITEGIDGSDVTPEHLNDWLLANNGFTADGSILWPEAMKYFGDKVSDEESKTYFSLNSHNEGDRTVVGNWLGAEGPVIAYSTPQGYRHYFVVDSLLDTGFEMSDPFWFNTVYSDQERNLGNNTQDYNDVYVAAQLIDVSKEAVAFELTIEIHLASPAELVVRDADGHKVGYNPKKDQSYEEIAGSQYDYETSLYSGDDDRPDEAHERKVARIFGADSGEYTVEVIGTDAGSYLLSIYTIDENGQSTLTEYRGEIKRNQQDRYRFDFVADGVTGDRNAGHGNDENKCDADNPGKKPQCTDSRVASRGK